MRLLPPTLALLGLSILACGPFAPADPSGETEQLRAELAECQAALIAAGGTPAAGGGGAGTPAEADPTPVPESPCGSIELNAAQAAHFSIVKAEAAGWSECNLVIEAKTAISRISFDWVFYDADGIRLGDRIEIIKDLEAGDKAKLDLRMDDATARSVSKPR